MTDLGHNPLIITGASASVLINEWIWIANIIWHEPTTTAHAVSVQDKDGNVVWAKTALAGGSGLDYNSGDLGRIKGLKVPTMGSGTLYIYIRSDVL